ncbi:helix-turn-helix domain-containing protein [Bacteroides heparinolyticus]|uniref:helix-turn-helix domain-containing protein n=1 Tax=Prevotella heparinolytica TaxID=28113 RepID=UPI0023F9FC7D|nr:helix-turn-helix domain-containing protein [Bacteroides heparinolyticus]MCI6211760.1 helix-turn-helix domain-containing protein [Bacteroides heparinolyticus]
MKRIAFLLFIFMLSAGSIYAVTPADSIRREMKHLEGKELLQAYRNLCRLATAQDDMQYELRCIREFLAEALKQKDAEAEGLARATQLYCYYNYDKLDSILFYLPESLKSMKKNKTWDYYYNAWHILVERYIYEAKLQTALLEVRKMYADARTEKNNYGLGVSSYLMGSIYQTMGRFREAEKSLTESIVALSKEKEISLLLSAYNVLGESLGGLGKYDRLRTTAEKWKSILDKYKEEALQKGYTPSLNGRYLYCTLAAAVAEIEMADYSKAGELLKQAEIYAEGRKAVAHFKLLQVQARYYAATRQYDKAVACNLENMEIITASGDSVSLLTVQTQQAEFLLKAGRYKEAAELYTKILPHKDRLRTTELASQLDELHTIYEVDKLSLHNEVITTRFYLSLIIGALLLLAIVLYIIYTRRLNCKNRILYNSILQYQKMQDEMESSARDIPEEQLDREGRIYRQLCELMQTEEVYKDAALNRHVLAERLGTNSAYLADAVRKYADGATVNEFINSYRLRRAASLLTGNFELNINEVEYQSGFNSRATFNRCFRACYGMSPSEYKAISKEKKMGK